MSEFGDRLIKARGDSPYPDRSDFSKTARISLKSLWNYECYDHLPTQPTLEKILVNCCIPKEVAEELRGLRLMALAKSLGLVFEGVPRELDVSELAEKIALEVQYELSRADIVLTPRTKKVCTRRIEMILKAALQKK